LSFSLVKLNNPGRKERGHAPMNHLGRLLDFLDSLPNGLIYFFLGLSAFVENICPPIPGDTITAFGAFLVGTERLGFMGVYLSTTIGSLAGFILLFWAGRGLGRRFFVERDYGFFKARDIIRAESWFKKYGYMLVLFNRFLPGLRSVISIAGGLSKLNLLYVTLLALTSACLWNLIFIWIGYTLGNNWETVRHRITDIMARYNMIVFIALGAILAFFVARGAIKKGKARKIKER
jgi:membrane protein DedA with SNARE-associated domain